ncbi:bacillithiol system redox-active protein YtxJ [Siminovitchia sp. FSL W7-1587]|uniref:bacillithiol system redox-active protein YtxJ n=1 Tax=Siminovitchia sp. FSL W7-1587 TaxID=2954699 RepID=UPI0030D1F694
MSTLIQLTKTDEWEKVLHQTNEEPVFIFKHSSTCPVSANAFKEYESFSTDMNKYFLIVSESRTVSNQIASDLDIKHESPQIFLLKDEKAVWNTSHWHITENNIKNAVKEHINS